MDTPHEIIFSYSVKFEESAIPHGSRWDIYLYNNEDKGVHWFSLTNSLLMALLLSVGEREVCELGCRGRDHSSHAVARHQSLQLHRRHVETLSHRRRRSVWTPSKTVAGS